MNNVKTPIIDKIKYFFSGRLLEKDYEGLSEKYVAAGDPLHVECVNLSTTKETPKDKDSKYFIVAGNSMLPRNVANGDTLKAKPYSQEESINKDDLLIIKVDKGLYKREEKWIRCKYKLRSAISEIAPNTGFESLYESVSEIEDSVLLPNNRMEMRSKYERAKKFYPNTPLVMSVTYKKGRIHYSFHPKVFVEYKGTII